jgi:nucleoid-associated protein YgaU
VTRTHRSTLALRTVLLLTGCAALCWGTWVLVRAPLVAAATPLRERPSGGLGQVPLETALTGGCAALLLACLVWAVAVTGLSVADLLARELSPCSRHTVRLAREVERRCPAMVRRLVAVLLGVTLGATLAAPALAAIDPQPAPVPSGQLSGQLSGLALPDRATGAGLATAAGTAISRTGTSGPSQRSAQFVEVDPGDSLWRIAQTLLPAGATDAEITHEWHRIHQANSDRIGADPDLIHAGTRLTVPPPLHPAHRKDRP